MSRGRSGLLPGDTFQLFSNGFEYEPDDRPRRGPRSPADQLDLLDPRNAEDRIHA